MPSPCELCAAIDLTTHACALQDHLHAGQPRRVGDNEHAAAIPTIGAFVPGYLLIVPTDHATSLGQLTHEARQGVAALTEQMADRLHAIYSGPVLGFEYGLNTPGGRRIEHGHLHLLPSAVGAALRQWLAWRLPHYEVASLAHLPTSSAHSYISVWEPCRPVGVYPVANDASPRIRLREVIASLDPRLRGRSWDWQTDPCTDLIRRTVDDLAPTAATTSGGPR